MGGAEGEDARGCQGSKEREGIRVGVVVVVGVGGRERRVAAVKEERERQAVAGGDDGGCLGRVDYSGRWRLGAEGAGSEWSGAVR